MGTGSRRIHESMRRWTSRCGGSICVRLCRSQATSGQGAGQQQPRNRSQGKINLALEPGFQMCCTAVYGRGKEPWQRHHSLDHYGRPDRAGDLLVQEVVFRQRDDTVTAYAPSTSAHPPMPAHKRTIGTASVAAFFGGEKASS